jgi:two-component system, OmpR family, sensor histidine kinase MprB
VSLRARLAVVAAAAVAVAVVLASVVVYFLVRGELRGQIDRDLQQEAGQVSQLQYHFGIHYANNVYVLPGRVPIGDDYFQIVDQAGRLFIPQSFLTSRPALPASPAALAVAAGRQGSYYSQATVGGIRSRILTEPAAPGTAVQVVAPLAGMDHELAKIRLWLFLVAIGGVGVASIAGFLVARASLAPLRELSETAERVRQTRDLSQRIYIRGTDELSQLAATFNAMLESLDEASQRQSQLVQDASHELRTPLTSLRTNIEVLARSDELPPEDREQLLRDVVDQLGEMTALIGELTELARGAEQEAPVEDVRLDLVAEEAIRRTARNHPGIPIDAQLEPTTVPGVPASLERAIANLLDNAAKWSPAGATIDVRLSDGELSVRDHGPGIADADLPHVFERFYRATNARSMPGSGLGLSIVQKVAEAHGGTVTAERADDGGTLMRLRVAAENGRPKANGTS